MFGTGNHLPAIPCATYSAYNHWLPLVNQKEKLSAPTLLRIAAETLAERSKDYDNPEGERSMKATVAVFNAVTGHSMTETEGWLFMCALKQVRAFTGGKLHADSMIDLIAYSALMAESAAE